MTSKERILAALKGEPVDRMPWSPFLAYWWEAQNEERQKMGQLKFMESIGADPMLRGFDLYYKVVRNGTEIRESQKGEYRQETWETPVGSITLTWRYSEAGNTWFLSDHPIHTFEDMKVFQWVYEHTTLEKRPTIDQAWEQTGERGLVMPLLGTECKTCFQTLVERWVGTENMAYFVADDPDKVHECLDTMRAVSDKTADICAESKAEAFIFWEDSSTTNISPAMFEEFTAPEIKCWADTLHASGKLLIHHACGYIRDLLPMMAATGIDAIESISAPPTGNTDIGETFKKLPPHIALVGGIEPVFFQNCTKEELEARVDQLLADARGRRYVLANSDSCPPQVEEWKFRVVTDRVRAWRG